MNYFITAIGTDSGKTVASAIVAEALNGDYWKPVQSGEPADSASLSKWAPGVTIHPEAYRLPLPASPHAAAKAAGICIRLSDIHRPATDNSLVIEGSGGVLVPLNEKETMIDLISWCQAEVIVVSNFYLGSINHTLLTLEVLKNRGVTIKGLIFNGPHNSETEDIIIKKSGLPVLLRINREKEINSGIIKKYAKLFGTRWDELGYGR